MCRSGLDAFVLYCCSLAWLRGVVWEGRLMLPVDSCCLHVAVGQGVCLVHGLVQAAVQVVAVALDVGA